MARSLTAGAWIFRIGAISNFLVTLPAFLAYDRYVAMFTAEPPLYPFLVWIWSGMAFLWGILFWEVSRDPLGKRALIKHSYLEKGVTSTAVIVAFLGGNVPTSFLIGVIYTDVIWIPLFAWVHWQVASAARTVPSAGPQPAPA
jgi:hypothetical protein